MPFPPAADYTRHLYRGVLLSDLITVKNFRETNHVWTKASIETYDRWNMAALWLAAHIVALRCGGDGSRYFMAWTSRLGGGPEHSEEMKSELEAFILDDVGTRSRPAPDKHFQGLLVEHLWHAIAIEQPGALGPAAHVEEPSWSSTDSGGDGLAIYRHGSQLVFRLWESKWHAAQGPARDTVNRAAKQLTRNGMRYLARWAQVGRKSADPEYADLYDRLVELWRQGDARAGAGVAVATPTGTDVEHCFAGIAREWSFRTRDQREGLLALVGELREFATDVREYLWNGL